MLYIFIIFLILSLIGISFKNVKNVDKSALSHERTITGIIAAERPTHQRGAGGYAGHNRSRSRRRDPSVGK